MTMGVVHKFLDFHSCVRRNGERASVSESNTELPIWSCLDDIAVVNEIANLRLADIGGEICLKKNGGRGGAANGLPAAEERASPSRRAGSTRALAQSGNTAHRHTHP